jgi:predicted HicB family RNase H-like nuclease
MNAGILQFTLGLGAGGFITALNQAEGKVKSFAGGLLRLPGLGTAVAGVLGSIGSVAGVVEGVFSAFEKGASLEHLSKRTGTAVATLFELQKGFKAVGLSTDDVGPALFAMQRSIGGVNEMGQSTSDIFTRMGLNVQQLKKLDPASQFTAIAKALNGLGQSDAAKASSLIFGRQQGGNMLQLARSGGDFSDAMRKAAGQAEIFARNAERFEKIERSLNSFKASVNGLFAGLAEGAAPGIQAVLDVLNSIDFSSIGKKFGEVLTVMTQSIRDQQFGKLIELSLNAGFEAAGNYAVATIWGLQAAMQKAFDNLMHPKAQTKEEGKKAGVGWLKAAERAIGGAHSAILGAGDLIFNAVTGSEGSEQKAAERIIEVDQAIESLNGHLGVAAPATRNFLKDSVEGTKDAFESSFKEHLATGSTSSAEALKAFYGRELARAKPVAEGEVNKEVKKAEEKTKLEPPKGENFKMDFTMLEKMGFVMSGLGNPELQHARTTAMNTTRMVALMETATRGEGGGEVVNQPL